MAQLSLLAETFKKRQNAAQKPAGRSTGRSPTSKGMARSSLGTSGSRTLQRRDVNAGLKKERELRQSPAYKAYIRMGMGNTPISDYIRGKK